MAKHECTQQEKINNLWINSQTMANDIKAILDTLKEQWDTLKNIEQFMALAPYKYADKEDTEKFKNWINLKIAYVSWIFAVISSVGIFLLNKLF